MMIRRCQGRLFRQSADRRVAGSKRIAVRHERILGRSRCRLAVLIWRTQGSSVANVTKPSIL